MLLTIMLMKNAIAPATCLSLLVAMPGFSQGTPIFKSEISVEAAASFENTNTCGTQQSAAVDDGFLGTFRFFLTKQSEAELSCGYLHNTQTYSRDRGSLVLKNNSDEMLAAVYTMRFPAKLWAPVVETATGALLLDFKASVGTQSQRADLGSGGGFNLKHQISPQTTHRGHFYNAATFNMDGLARFMYLSEPSVVFGYTV